MKIRSLLLGLLLIAPGLQASEVAPKTDEELKEQAAESVARYLAQNQATEDEYTAVFLIAVKNSNVALTKKLLAKVNMKKFNTIRPHPLFKTWDDKMVELLLPHVDINMEDAQEGTLLRYYCLAGQCHTSAPQCVKLVLERRPENINARDLQGYTALARFINPLGFSTERIPLLQTLLSCNADPYIEDKDGNTIPQFMHKKFADWIMPKEPDLVNKTITLLTAQRPRRIAGLQAALYPYLTQDTAGVVIGYLPEGFQEEQARQAKSGALTKISESE